MVFDLFSKRSRLEKGDISEIYTYDELPEKLRVQITYIFDDTFTCTQHFSARKEEIYKVVAEILREERGVYQLSNANQGRGLYGGGWLYEEEVKNYFLNEKNIEYALDVIELLLRLAHNVLERNYSHANWQSNFSYVVEKLNTRFKESAVGYAYEGKSILKKDNELIHQTIIKPTLKLLHDQRFKNAEDEYLKAHEHYRHNQYEDCVVNCLKAMETTIKIIGHKRKWKIQQSDTASQLIKHVMDNKLIPDYLQTHFNALRSCLESGVPTVRNKEGGHGKGIKPASTPSYLAEYLLGETATTIKLLIEADKAA